MLKIKNALQKNNIGVAAGEQVQSVTIFKQLLQTSAIDFCQIDATRLGGVNDVIAVILLCKKFNIPVCPHGGGIGLCNMIQHYAAWDQISIAGPNGKQVVEYLDFLQTDVFETQMKVNNGSYFLNNKTKGWGLEIFDDFLMRHEYPTGEVWAGRVNDGSILFS